MFSEYRQWQKNKYQEVVPSIENSFQDNQVQKQLVTREDIEEVHKPHKPAFILRNVLTRDECKKLIQASEKQGFEGAESYCHMYRDRYNDRLMSDDELFSKIIWERVEHLLPKTMKHLRRPSDKLELDSLNARWRYCRYLKGHYFGGHTDGKYVNGNLESMLTFMLYLNGPKTSESDPDEVHFDGGATNFLNYRTKELAKSVVPEPGLALVFLQEDIEMYHEGEKLNDGMKYILRSDVMYKVSH